MEDVAVIWEEASGKLRDLLNEDTYDRWIAGIVPLALDDGVCRLGVSNDIFSEWLANNYREIIVGALEKVTGKAVRVAFESGHEYVTPSKVAKPRRGSLPSSMTAEPSVSSDALRYNRRFTFDTFVVGENNKFAHAASMAVAKNLGKAYNPLFIHGGTGLGKTHLVQGIAHEVLQRRKRARVEYLTSEEFANKYIDALAARALPKFRNHYRNVDLILIDDVHFFNKGKEQLQEEFFHTFNTLYNGHKQIVMTSDRPPHEIPGLEKRLVSRFEWGLTTEVSAPDYETRVAILRRKQEEHAVKLDDAILGWVASRIKSNIRRLEGALIRLVSHASLTGAVVDQQAAEQLLRPLLDEESAGLLTIEQIQRTVAEYFDIRLADMTSKKRPKNIAFPRQVAMYLCRELTEFSSPAIAEGFNRNHATVLHAESMVRGRVQSDPETRASVISLKRRLLGATAH